MGGQEVEGLEEGGAGMGVIMDMAHQEEEGSVGGEGEGLVAEGEGTVPRAAEQTLEGQVQMAMLQDLMAAECMVEEVVRRGTIHRVHLKNVADTRLRSDTRILLILHLLYLCVFNATSSHRVQRVVWG